MNYYEAGDFFDYLIEEFSTSRGRSNLRKLISLVKEFSKDTSDTSEKNNELFDEKITRLIDLLERYKYDAVILILKNKNSLFDMFIFERGFSTTSAKLVSSETFQNALREHPISGYVIDNISNEDILIFLKAYYIYRRDPKLSSTASNMVYEYSWDSFEMASISDKFLDNDEVIKLKSIILYDKDALPYSLNYLNEYHENYQKKVTNKLYNIKIKDVLTDVRKNKFLGMSLKRF